ncbi:MAG: glycosyltransferase [Victivallales bacterium]|jgi:glycosyltransferase involved in cell wall biosynthesis|nr:glycosyltransferase [Victivallales bacterium]
MTYGVVTICRNAAETVQRCIESVLAQSPPPAQYVVVDGGSTDGTLDKVGEMAEGAPGSCEFSLVHQATPPDGVAGIPNAWNLGLRDLHADVVVLLNADDWLEPDAAGTVLAEFAAAPDADLMISPIRIVTGEGERILHPRPFWLFPFLMPVMHPGCFVRQRAYDRVGAFDERYRISADYDFMYRCRRAGCVFRSYAGPLVSMQWGGMARQNLPTARRETLAIARRHCPIPGLPWLAYLLRTLMNR